MKKRRKLQLVLSGIVLFYCVSMGFLFLRPDLSLFEAPVVSEPVKEPIPVEIPKKTNTTLISVSTVLYDVGGLENFDPELFVIPIKEEPVIEEPITLIEEPVETQTYSADLSVVSDEPVIDMSDDFLSLCSVIHYEAGVAASLDSKIAVGCVVINRLNDSKWGYSNLHDVIYADGQFNVTEKASFESLKDEIRSGDWSPDLENTIVAANTVISSTEACQVPSDVQFFYGDPDKRTWGDHVYCFTAGGNSFFK